MEIPCTEVLERVAPEASERTRDAERCRHIHFFDDRRMVRRLNLPRAVRCARHEPPIDCPPELRSFLAWVLNESGLRIEDYRLAVLVRRAPACLRAIGCRSLDEARRVLQWRPWQMAVAASALLIGVTSFFRDEAVFQAIGQQVVPRWENGARPRILSVGCSDGAEPYSVAMLLAQAGVLERAELVAVDCRYDALARAAGGVYDARQLAGLPRGHCDRFFLARGETWQVVRPLRQAIEWRQCAADDPPSGPWDLILCRNLAIYFEPAAAKRLWKTLAAVLAPGGVLATGKAERPDGLPWARLAPCLYEKP